VSDSHPTNRNGELADAADGEVDRGETGWAAVSISSSNSQTLSAEGRKSVAIGSLVGAAIFALPLSRFVFGYLGVLVHEMGHTFVDWVFGYPSVPAFDFRYGGGVTIASQRSPPLLLVILGLLAFLLYALRRHPWPRNLAGVLALAYALVAFTPLHEVLQLAMGHGMELLIAGVFLFRALGGRAITHAIERPLYAACGAFMILSNTSMAWRLIRSAEAREIYGAAKGGGHWMDLSRLGHDYLGLGLPTVAFLMLLVCLATPALAYLAFRYEPWLVERFDRFFDLSR